MVKDHKGGQGSVRFEKKICTVGLWELWNWKSIDLHNFSISFTNSTTVKEQQKLCENLSTVLNSKKDSMNNPEFLLDLCVLCFAPGNYPVKKSLLWAFSLLKSLILESAESVAVNSVKLVFNRIFNDSSILMNSSGVDESLYFNSVQSIFISISSLISVERETGKSLISIGSDINFVDFWELMHCLCGLTKRTLNLSFPGLNSNIFPTVNSSESLDCIEEGLRQIGAVIKLKMANLEMITQESVRISIMESVRTICTDIKQLVPRSCLCPTASQEYINGANLCLAALNSIRFMNSETEPVFSDRLREMHLLSAFIVSNESYSSSISPLFSLPMNDRISVSAIYFSYFRAVITLLNDNDFISLCVDSANSENSLMHCVLSISRSSNAKHCLLGFQIMETLICRISGIFTDISAGAEHVDFAADNRSSLIKLWLSESITFSQCLTGSWSHQLKQVGHMIPIVYEKLVLSLLSVTQVIEKFKLDTQYDWCLLLMQALSQSVFYRGRYQALTLLFNKVPNVHLLILKLQPNIIKNLIDAVKHRDVSSASCSCLCALLVRIKEDMIDLSDGTDKNKKLSYFRQLWADDLIDALCGVDVGNSNDRSEINVAEYIVPEITSRVDNECSLYIINRIRERNNIVEEKKLWGLCHLTLHARQNGLPGAELFDDLNIDHIQNGLVSASEPLFKLKSSGPLTLSELYCAAISDNVDLRILAFTVIVVSSKSIASFPEKELEFFKSTFHLLFNCPLPDHRHKVGRVIRTLYVRLRECERSDLKQLKQVHTRVLKIMGNDDMKLKVIELFGEMKSIILGLENTTKFVKWFSEMLVDKLSPGCIYDCQMMCMDIISSALDGLDFIPPQMQKSDIPDSYDFSEISIRGNVEFAQTSPISLRKTFITGSLVNSIILYCASSWDRCRSTASEILLRFPTPLPGFMTYESVQAVVNWGYSLANSVRQREADAGSLILSMLFIVYAVKLNVGLSVSAENLLWNYKENNCDEELTLNESSIQFLESLWTILENRLIELEKLYLYVLQMGLSNLGSDMDKEEQNVFSVHLCHGVIAIIEKCINLLTQFDCLNIFKMKKKFGSHASEILNKWKVCVQKIFISMVQAFNIAQMIVAEATTDSHFAPIIDDNSEHEGGCVGPVHANNFVDTKSNMLVNSNGFNENFDEEGDDNDVEVEGTTRRASICQRAVVSAWLVTKGSVQLLARMIELFPDLIETIKDCPFFVATARCESVIEQCGQLLLDSLCKLRHLGAIMETQNAFQKICEFCLRASGAVDSFKRLRSLPMQWLNNLLDRLWSKQQVFILRRSAGFAGSFIAVLRSESSLLQTVLFERCFVQLLKYAEEDLAVSLLAASASDRIDERFRRCVHTLNIIRLILLDGVLTSSSLFYISECARLAIMGFKSVIWGVRNSCMMLFTTVVQKSIDNEKNFDSQSELFSRRTSTVFDYFKQRPTLFPYVLNEFKVSNELGNVKAESLENSLYPMLLFLAKLKPAFCHPIGEIDKFTPSFLPYILENRGHRVYKVRIMVARALSSVLPVCEIPTVIMNICGEIDENKTELTLNFLHGSLLCISVLMEIAMKYRKYSVKKRTAADLGLLRELDKNIITALRTFLQKFSGVAAKFPAVLSLPYLNTLNFALFFINGVNCDMLLTTEEDIVELKASCIREIGNLSYRTVRYGLLENKVDPCCQNLYQVTFSCIFGLIRLGDTVETRNGFNKSELLQLLCKLYSEDRFYAVLPEVQLNICLAFHLSLDSIAKLSISKLGYEEIKLVEVIMNSLIRVGLKQLSVVCTVLEASTSLLCRLFALFYSDLSLLATKSYQQLTLALFNLCGGTTISRSTSHSSYSLELLGWLMNIGKSSCSNTFKSEVKSWLGLLGIASLSKSPVNMRVSAARSILSACSAVPEEFRFEMLTILLFLLQDDDNDVRIISGHAVNLIWSGYTHGVMQVLLGRMDDVRPHEQYLYEYCHDYALLERNCDDEERQSDICYSFSPSYEFILENFATILSSEMKKSLVIDSETDFCSSVNIWMTHFKKISLSNAPLLSAFKKVRAELSAVGSESNASVSSKIFTAESENNYYQQTLTTETWINTLWLTMKSSIRDVGLSNKALNMWIYFINTFVLTEVDSFMDTLIPILSFISNLTDSVDVQTCLKIFSIDEVFLYVFSHNLLLLKMHQLLNEMRVLGASEVEMSVSFRLKEKLIKLKEAMVLVSESVSFPWKLKRLYDESIE